VIQPELKEIREKYKDNRELQTQETMNLFKEHNVNPMGSCLPMLLQLPVWFALYNTMLYSVELYNTSFLIFDDLTAPDPYGILPTLYVLLMVGQQRMMPMASMDPTQRKVMKMMPLIFGFFMYTFPSGLVLYFCVNMALTIFQQWIIKKNLKPLPTAEPAS
jgi:YidC/Oxa1 family membrane protein insertase